MNCLITHSMVQSIYTHSLILPVFLIYHCSIDISFEFSLCITLYTYTKHTFIRDKHENIIIKFILTTKLFVIVIDRIKLIYIRTQNNYDDIQ